MRALIAVLLLFATSMAASDAKVRIKDITSVRGVRDNQLVGYGLVVGLHGTGDTLRNSVFTEQALQSMLDRMGVAVRSGAMRTRNVASVVITADMPPFCGIGVKIDVTVSSLGDATSLMGGTLIMTPLVGPDGVMYAAAQGAVSVVGFVEAGKNEVAVQGVPTSGRIPNGATMEREVDNAAALAGPIVLELRNPDFRTAVRVSEAINRFAQRKLGRRVAVEQGNRAIAIEAPVRIGAARLLAEIGDLTVEPDTPARVVMDARSGTVVIGADVKISSVAVTHGALSVRITETPAVSQPNPLSQGKTAIVSQSEVVASQEGGRFSMVGGASLKAVVRGLNQIGLKPMGVMSILQAIKSAGALQAEIVVQ